ncbi:MBOAT family protein [Trichocoleus sp. ST-U2]|uniref:MBOAT family O-acyltransferase n=2 Tax=Cyanobacteriota TaxID=1117 RepID=UPI0030D7E9FB
MTQFNSSYLPSVLSLQPSVLSPQPSVLTPQSSKMTFISLIYGVFLLSVLGIYWSFQKQSLQMWTLLVVSLVFYTSLQAPTLVNEHWLQILASPQVAYIPLLIAITLMNFSLGKAIGENTALGMYATDPHEDWQFDQAFWNRQRLKFLWLGIVLNVLLLVSFKYVPFFLNSVAGFYEQFTGTSLPVAENSASWVSTHLIAPLGLSFFSFECIAYLIDVYRGAPATERFLDFAAYKLFFPKLIAGPITRYHQFSTQLKTLQFPTLNQITEGLWLIACGAVKKALLADRLGIFVDLCFGNLERASSGDLWLAIAAYGLQLYLDFSGYVDIARGSAILLGFNLPENFNFPYFSTSIADFWRRWHITLGDWLRNYLYFPLGGSRQGLRRTCLNLLIIMLIAGIWHGAAWGYVVWGAYHGLALVAHRLTEAHSRQSEKARNWWKSLSGVLLAWLLTQFMVFTSWIFFRLPNLKQSSWVIQHLWGQPADAQFAEKVYGEALGVNASQLGLLLWLLAASMLLVYAVHRGLKLQLNWPLKLLLVPLCFYIVWIFAPQGGLPYIYFDF